MVRGNPVLGPGPICGHWTGELNPSVRPLRRVLLPAAARPEVALRGAAAEDTAYSQLGRCDVPRRVILARLSDFGVRVCAR